MQDSQNDIKNCYEIAKAVYEKKMTRTDGIKKLVELKINAGSAQIIIKQIFPGMMAGRKFTRTLSAPYFEYFLSNILSDFGADRFALVLSSIDKHIQYNVERGKPKNKLKLIYKKYLLLAESNETLNHDENEQEEIGTYLKKHQTRSQVIHDLKNVKTVEPEIVVINNKAYKRDNKTIAQIKYIRGYQCQICKVFISKKDGGQYVEAAHIIHKHKAGPETPENILILCPNHHKEFDLGNLEILNHTKDQISFSLNGKSYLIDLKISI